MRLRAIMAIGVTAAFATACDSSIVDPRDFEVLASAEARWKARPFADYSYEIRVGCFCPPEVTRWTRVSVRDGAVVAVEAVEPDPAFPITNTQYWEPIDSIFVDLRLTMEDPATDTYLDAIIVSYHATLGYPTSIEYRAKPNVVDGGSVHSLRNVQPLD
ncbi:MAG TPA: DUF6174 domain-containing protein [Gemmatimonadaceae bacterium]